MFTPDRIPAPGAPSETVARPVYRHPVVWIAGLVIAAVTVGVAAQQMFLSSHDLNLLLVVLVAAGLLAAPNMRAQFFPDVIIESVSVDVRWDGAGAEDVDNAVDNLSSLLEPMIMAILGVMVGGLVVAMYLPIFKMGQVV